MFWFIASIVLTVVVFIVICYFNHGFTSKAFLSLICLLVMFVGCIASVPTGYTGIMVEFGRVLDQTLESGIQFKSPLQNVVTVDNRTQKVGGVAGAFSSDIQQVDVQYSINYNIDKSMAMVLYKTVGMNYYETVVAPRLIENLKGVVSQYNADALVAKRESLSEQITSALANEMVDYGINILNVNIENIDFTDAFTNAVESKQVAEQTKLKAQTEQQQLVMEANAKAERDVIEANAQAEKDTINAEVSAKIKKVQADADLYAARQAADAAKYARENEAAANEKLSKSITEALTNYLHVQRWNGQMPLYVGSEGNATIPVLDLTGE